MDPVRERYRGTNGAEYHFVQRGIPEAAYLWVARSRAAKLRPLIAKEDEVLEYGVGWGWNLALTDCRRKLGYDVESALAPKLAERGIEFIDDTRGLESGVVNVVLCHHTLEHCLRPPDELAEMLRLLRPGGRLILVVPYETQFRLRKYQPNARTHHLYGWTTQYLGNLATACGFRVLQGEVKLYGYDRFASVWSSRFGCGEWGYRILTRIGRVLVPLREIRMVAQKPGAPPET